MILEKRTLKKLQEKYTVLVPHMQSNYTRREDWELDEGPLVTACSTLFKSHSM